MNILKNIKNLYHLNALEKGVNFLQQTDDDDALWKQINKNVEHVDSIKQLFHDDPVTKQKVFSQPLVARHIRVLFAMQQHIENFIQKEFDKDFHMFYGLLSTTQDPIEKHLYLNFCIDSLGQIKTDYINNDQWIDYNTRFFYVEDDLTKRVEAYYASMSKIDSHEDSSGINPKITVNYDGNLMGLAYLKFLDHNISQAESYIQQQANIFGKEAVLEHEVHKESLDMPQIWYYNYIDQEKKQEFNELLVISLSQHKKNHISTSIPPKLN